MNFELKKENTMDFIIAGIVAVGLLFYLAYAMFNPDKFK
jgi:K+-transporting ATPase KdpF subunit